MNDVDSAIDAAADKDRKGKEVGQVEVKSEEGEELERHEGELAVPLVSSRSASYYVEEAEEEGRAAATSSCSLDAPLVSSRGASYYVEEEAEVAFCSSCCRRRGVRVRVAARAARRRTELSPICLRVGKNEV